MVLRPAPARVAGILLALLLTATSAPAPAPPDVPGELQTFLRKHVRFTEADLAAVTRGQVVAKVLDASDRREIAAFGIVRVRVPPDFFVDQFRDIVAFKRSSEVLQIGKFGTLPRLDDLRDLTLDQEELQALRKCRVGDCDLQLPAEAIARLRRELNWSAQDAEAQATALFKQILADYASAYFVRGDEALKPYADRRELESVPDAFRAILGESPFLVEYVPEFHAYLRSFPNAGLPSVENFLYWSKERFGLKPVISVTHAAIYQRPQAALSRVVIASKQIYASHYFDASLGLTAVIDAPDERGPGIYVLYLNRSRSATLGRFLARLLRPTIRGRTRDGVESNLRQTKERLETRYRAATAAQRER